MRGVRELDENLGTAFRFVAEATAEGRVEDRSGLLLFAGAHPYPGWMNGALRLSQSIPPHEAIGRALDFFSTLGRGFRFWVRGHADADLADELRRRGHAPRPPQTGMVLEELPICPPVQPGVSIVRLVHPRELRDLATVVATAYAETGMPPAAAEATFGDAQKLLRPEIDCYVAYEADAPVACSMAITTEHLVGIYWVGTIPAARRRGLGTAVALAAITGGIDPVVRGRSSRQRPRGGSCTNPLASCR